MRISIDPEMCQGNGLCVARAPVVFELGDDERALALQTEVDHALEEQVRSAVNACPTQAISIDDH